jgi:hypothetical protein
MRAEVIAGERLQLHPDRQAALKLRQQVAGLVHMERARRDEEHMVGLHRAVFGRHRRAFDQRQQIALHAFAADIGALGFGARATLSISSRKTMPSFRPDLMASDCNLAFIQQLVGFLIDQRLIGGFHRRAQRLGAAAKAFAQQVGD